MPEMSVTAGDHARPDVSVVIPALDGATTLPVQLEALARQQTTRSFEVLVADNGSRDTTPQVVDAFAGRLLGLRLVDASARRGSNVARNIGISAARSQTVLLCDSDDEVDEHWVERLAVALETADTVGGRLEMERLNPEYGRRWGGAVADGGVSMQLDFLPRPIGANAGLRREVWERLGGFDERYVRGGTETEFFWRAQLAGFTLADAPDAVVHYRLRSSFRALVRQTYVWGRQHAMLYRDFRDHGLELDLRTTGHDWGRLAHSLWPLPRGPWQRLSVCRRAAYRVGRLVGSYRYRVLFP